MASVEKLPMLAEGYERLIAELKALRAAKIPMLRTVIAIRSSIRPKPPSSHRRARRRATVRSRVIRGRCSAAR